MKAVKESDDLPANMEPPISALLYARCAEHFKVPQLNASESDGAECGACVGEEVKFLNHTLLDVLDVLAARLLASSIRKKHLQQCIDRINFLVPEAGDQLLQELANDFQRHTHRRLWIEGRHNHELRGRWLLLENDHPMRQMALAIEEEVKAAMQSAAAAAAATEGATDGGSEHHEDGTHAGAGGGEAVPGQSEADPERGSS